jgi:hypothetical protein
MIAQSEGATDMPPGRHLQECDVLSSTRKSAGTAGNQWIMLAEKGRLCSMQSAEDLIAMPKTSVDSVLDTAEGARSIRGRVEVDREES